MTVSLARRVCAGGVDLSHFLFRPGDVSQRVLPNCDHPVTLAVAANHLRGMLDSVAAAGDPAAQDALGEYLDVWSRTVALMANTAEGLQTAIRASIAGYTAADQSAADRLRPTGRG
jgi:hypothetical protein